MTDREFLAAMHITEETPEETLHRWQSDEVQAHWRRHQRDAQIISDLCHEVATQKRTIHHYRLGAFALLLVIGMLVWGGK